MASLPVNRQQQEDELELMEAMRTSEDTEFDRKEWASRFREQRFSCEIFRIRIATSGAASTCAGMLFEGAVVDEDPPWEGEEDAWEGEEDAWEGEQDEWQIDEDAPDWVLATSVGDS